MRVRVQKRLKNENVSDIRVLTVRFYISKLNEHIQPCRCDVCVLVFLTFLKPPTQLQPTRSPRLLNGFWSFLVQKKLRVCLFCFFCFQYTFVELKAPKTFSEVKSCVFFRAQIPKVEGNLLVDAEGNTWKNNDILREIKIVRSGSLNQQEKLLQTKYQLNRSIFATCMPKKIKNLGIKSLTLVRVSGQRTHARTQLLDSEWANNWCAYQKAT